MLSRNFTETVKSFLTKDVAYQFMGNIKATPAYWKKFLFEVLVMVKQLVFVTFFMTLSCANLKWDELISIIASLSGENFQREDMENMDFFTRSSYLNLNLVLLARHFRYRVVTFFQVNVLDGPLGKVKYHPIGFELQVRRSPHVHSFLWVLHVPILSKDNIDEYILFVDSIVKATFPNFKVDPSLFDLFIRYQIHSQSRSCHKYKNQVCRYHFGKLFTKQTIIDQPMSRKMSHE